MKISKISILSFVLGGALVLVSCGSEEKKDDKKKEKTEKKDDAEADKEEVNDEPKAEANDQYSKDWEEIKTAIKNNDIPGVGKFAGNENVDAELLITLARDHHIWQVLESYEFKDLKVEEENGVTYHTMYAFSEQDGAKKELKIFLEKGETNLAISHFQDVVMK